MYALPHIGPMFPTAETYGSGNQGMGVRLVPLPVALSDPLEKCALHVPTLVWALANEQSWFSMGVEEWKEGGLFH